MRMRFAVLTKSCWMKILVKMVLYCKLCSYCCEQSMQLLKHIFYTHSVEANFRHTCGIKGCLYTFKSGQTFESFKSHATRKHPNWQDYLNMSVQTEIIPTNELGDEPSGYAEGFPNSISNSSSDEPGELMEIEPIDEPEPNEHASGSGMKSRGGIPTDVPTNSAVCNSVPSAERTAATFLLAFKEQYKLTQTAINYAVGAINGIVHGVCSDIQLKLEEMLSDTLASDERCLADMFEVFEYDDPFASLRTEHHQLKYYKDEFGLIEPESVILGSSYRYIKSGRNRKLVEVNDTYQYVPLLKNLQWILNNSDIYNEVFKKRTNSTADSLTDAHDGTFYQEHPLFGIDEQALQLHFYYDDMETSNPLGSYRGKHKLGLFYYVLGNIEPRLRSSLRCIQLVACVTTPNLDKYGLDLVLERFIADVNKLAQGVPMTIGGKQQIVKGSVLYALADTPAAHSLGGFKSGVGFALRKCRVCLATYEQMSTKFMACQFTPRTVESYNYHCSLLQGPLASEDSVTYGINYESPLNKIENFHVIDQLPQDIMHVLFEGVVPYELRHMLVQFVKNKFFTVSELNERILSFCYSTHDSGDRPSEINPRIFASSEATINQSAIQMWVLSVNLPLIIGDKIPEDSKEWECFLLLLDIIKLCTSRKVSKSHAGYLEVLIRIHHQLFVECYPTARIIPKMHYMVHLPKQILRTGPLICTWCTRMEAKNSYFKRAAQVSNFKNVPYSVANRHQRLLCSYLQSSNFFNTAKQYGPMKQPTPAEMSALESSGSGGEGFQKVAWVKHMGAKYHPKAFVIIGWQDDDLPIFGSILSIFANEKEVCYKVSQYRTIGIARHYHSFVIEATQSEIFVNEFADYVPLNATVRGRSLYVTVRYHVEK